MSELLRKKFFPLNYPEDVMTVISAMAISPDIEVVGSQAMRSSLYSADYDLLNEARADFKNINDAAISFAAKLKEVIMRLMSISQTYIGDIKCGMVSEWKIPLGKVKGKELEGYNKNEIIKKMQELREQKVITDGEYDTVRMLVKENPKFNEWLELKEVCKFHVIRWTPKQLLRGYNILRNGATIQLSDAIKTPGLIKIDAISYIEGNRFSDFSCIYMLYNKKDQVNKVSIEANAIKEDIMALGYEKEYFKMLKRMLSIAKVIGRTKDIEPIISILNSQLGILYSIISDAKTIIFLLENEDCIDLKVIKQEIDNFRGRLGNIYSVPGTNTPGVLEKLLTISKLPSDMKGRVKMYKQMTDLIEFFNGVLNKQAKEAMGFHKLLPLDPIYLP
jgi:hypothetical protein